MGRRPYFLRGQNETVLSAADKWKYERQLPKVGDMWNTHERVVEIQRIPQLLVITELIHSNIAVNFNKYRFL